MKKFFTLSFFIILLLGFNYCSKLAANNNDTPVTETQTTSSSDVYNSSQSTSSQDLSSELLNSVPPGTIGLKPDEFKNMWNNFAIASNLKRIIISDLIVSEGELQNSCQFMFNDKIGLMATINKADGSIRDVTIISQPAGDKMAAMDTMAAWGALIYVTNPGLSPEERGKILSDLGILDVGQGQIDINSIDTSTIRGKIKYHLQVIKGIGIIFNASDSNDNDGQIQNKNNFVDDNKFIFKSEKGEESLNTSDNKSLMPEDLSYYPNKNIQAIRQIPEEFYNDENINKENVLDYILENPVNDDAEQIIRRTLIHNNIDTTFFDGMVRYNKENNLLEKAAEALEENDYRIYLWNKMRLEAIEFLDNINFINKNSKELMLPDSDIKESSG